MATLPEQDISAAPRWLQDEIASRATTDMPTEADALGSAPAWAIEEAQGGAEPEPQLDRGIPAWAVEEQVSSQVLPAGSPAWAVEEVSKRMEQPAEGTAGFSVGDVAKGIAIESIGGIGSNMAGAALAAALAPVTGGVSLAVYLGVSFAGGLVSSIAAQRATGNGNVSPGSAIFSGVINALIPGGRAAASAITGGAKITKATIAQSAKREALRGATLGAGDASARAIIDEGRMPTMSELAVSGGVGTLLGGTIGSVTPLAVRSYRKIAGKTVQEIDDAVSRGEVTGEDILNMTTGNGRATDQARVNVTADVNSAGAANDAVNAVTGMMEGNPLARPGIWRRVLASIAPSSAVPREVVEAVREYRHMIQASEQLGAKIQRRIDTLYRGNQEARDAINRFIDTGQESSIISEIMPDLQKFRTEQKRLSLELAQQIDEGSIARLTQEQREIFTREIARSGEEGTYTRTQYKLFEDVTFTPDPELRQPAILEIAESIVRQGYSRKRAMREAEKHLDSLIRQSAKHKALQGRNPDVPVTSSLKAKTFPGPAERAYLGEITDPGERIRGTLDNVTRLVERNKANNVIRDALAKNGLLSRSSGQGANMELILRGETFNGDYVDEGTLRALNRLYLRSDFSRASDDLASSAIKDIWGTFNVASKASKVIFNPPTYAVNFLSSIFMVATQGINMVSAKNRARFWEGLQAAATDLNWVDKLKSRTVSERRLILEMTNDMDKYGITNGTVVVEDARRAAKMGKVASGMFEKIVRPFGAAYSSFDTAARYVSWKNNQDMIRRITGSTDEELVKRLAAEITNNQYPNYNFLSNYIRQGSAVGVLNPFVAFVAELNRNVFQQVKSARQMINGTYMANRGITLDAGQLAALRAEGTKRLASLVGVGAGASAMLYGLNQALGTSGEKEAAMRETLIPDWDKNKSLILSQSNDGKSLSYANASYIIPHLTLTKAIEYATLDLDPLSAAQLIADDFAGEGTLAARAVFRAIFNQDQRGEPISRSDNTAINVAERVGFAIDDALTPGAFREADRFLRASRGQGQLTVGDVAARQVGYRVNKMDIADTAVFTLRKDVDNARAFQATYRRARDYQGVAPGQLAVIYQEQNKNYRRSQEQMIRHNRNLATLGMDEKARIDVMKRAGMSSRDILNALNGVVVDMPREPRVTVSSVYETLPTERKARVEAIREISRSNPKMGRDLLRMMQREQKDSRSGITDRESLIKNLSVPERVEMIFESDDPRATLREWQRKGLASTSVTREVLDRLRSLPAAR